MNRPDDQPEPVSPQGASGSGIPLPEEWLGLARSFAHHQDVAVVLSEQPNAGPPLLADGRRVTASDAERWERFWTPARRVEAEQRLGRDATPADWQALHGAIRSIALLARLPKEGAPQELEGRVVASLHAGHRQARAAEFVSSLPMVRAPRSLDDLVAQRIGQERASEEGNHQRSLRPAPPELDSRVAESLADPEASLVRGMAGRLDAVDAPAELDTLVDRSLSGAADGAHSNANGAVRSAVLWGGAVMATAAAVVLMIVGSRAVGSQGDSQLEPSETARVYPEFQVERIDPSSLSKTDRWILGAAGAADFGGQG